MSKHIHIPLEENNYYHIYNRGNDGIDLFYQRRNYHYFLVKYDYYLSNYVDTYAYCLLPNHFHLLIRVKKKSDFVVRKSEFPKQEDICLMTAGEIVSELFRRFFMSFSKSINIQQNRTGSLFQKNFRRKLVNNQPYFLALIYYIHHQLKHHGFDHLDDKDYPWSSYQKFLIDRESKLKKMEVFSWFGSKAEFVSFHSERQDLKMITNLIIEE